MCQLDGGLWPLAWGAFWVTATICFTVYKIKMRDQK